MICNDNKNLRAIKRRGLQRFFYNTAYRFDADIFNFKIFLFRDDKYHFDKEYWDNLIQETNLQKGLEFIIKHSGIEKDKRESQIYNKSVIFVYSDRPFIDNVWSGEEKTHWKGNYGGYLGIVQEYFVINRTAKNNHINRKVILSKAKALSDYDLTRFAGTMSKYFLEKDSMSHNLFCEELRERLNTTTKFDVKVNLSKPYHHTYIEVIGD